MPPDCDILLQDKFRCLRVCDAFLQVELRCFFAAACRGWVVLLMCGDFLNFLFSTGGGEGLP